MATRGRKPTPVEEKRRLGNPGKRPLPAAGSLAVVPALPRSAWDLPPAQALEMVLGHGVGWLAETDSVQVALLRESLEAVRDAGQVGSVRDRLEAIKVASSMLSELGFTPSARSRFGLAEVKTPNKLEQMQQSRKT